MFSKTENQILNIGSSKPKKVSDLVKLISSNFITIPKRPGEPFITWADIKKAKKILRWTPKTSFENGIKNLINDIDYWKNAPLWDRKKIKIATKNWFRYLK